MENYTFLICACLSIKYVSVTNVLKRGRGLWVKSRGGLEGVGGIKSRAGVFYIQYHW